jgi:UDPglucose--hexose-1-phosphate uridylyltransferase
MSIIRQDPTTKEWVIIATERAKRPHEFKKKAVPRSLNAREESCPFCTGNEGLTPTEVLRLDGSLSAGWVVRVVPNRFSALKMDGEPLRREIGPLFREMEGVGYHEVIVEGPVHNRLIPIMTDGEVSRIFEAYQKRYLALRDDPRIRYIIIFKNHGTGAGTSLEHPHSQLVATPVAPMQIRQKYEVAIAHYDDTGRCLYCDLVEEEQRAKIRMVTETERFVVFHPYASRLPFETWIAPKLHQPSFGQLTQDGLQELARVVRHCLGALYTVLGDPDFNYIIHTAPVEGETHPYYLWHIQILPRLAMIAGFELGSGIAINTILPEESAAFMRDFEGGVQKSRE